MEKKEGLKKNTAIKAPLKKEEVVRKIANLFVLAQQHAQNIGIPNILLPGLARDVILADKLGHDLILIKKDADACDLNDPLLKYEYVSCNEGGSFPVDKMFKVPPKNGDHVLSSIARNSKIYFVIFYGPEPLKIKFIYEVKPATMYSEMERQLEANGNDIATIIFTEQWAMDNGNIIYRDKKELKEKNTVKDESQDEMLGLFD